jgi:hypothetical protein
MEYKAGQILNFKENGDLFGKAIKFYNKIVYGEEGYAHTAIILKTNPLTVAQAMPSGFEIKEWYLPWFNNEVNAGKIVVGETTIPLKNVEETARKYEGTPYGFLDILSIGTILLFRGRSIGFTGSKAIICSEAIARLLYDCSDKKIMLGFGKLKDKALSEFKKSYDLITPMDISKSKFIKWIQIK